MNPNAYAVVLDSSVLAKDLHRHLLAHLARAGLFRPILSDTILNETEAAINGQGRDGARVRGQLENVFAEAIADPAYIHLVRKFQLADENDRHVVAVALQEHADAICTDNVKDLGLSTVDVMAADQFIADTVDLAPPAALRALASMRKGMRSVSDGREFVALIRERGLTQVADLLAPYAARL